MTSLLMNGDKYIPESAPKPLDSNIESFPNRPVPRRVTDTEYDSLMREMWEVRQLVAEYRGMGRIRQDLDIVEKEIYEMKKELSIIHRMCLKIGTALFKKAVK